METDGYQKELFELEKPKRSFPRLDKILSRNDFAITLTMERMIFTAIGLIMLAILIYAVGVERGKALGMDRGKEVCSKPAAITLAVPSAAQKNAPGKIYSIVAVSFSRREWALREAESLKKAGYDAFVYESSPYFLVCVGSYANKESPQAALKKIKKIYKDAYLKLR